MGFIPGNLLANLADSYIGLAWFLDPMRVVLNAVVYGVSWLGLTSKSLWKRVLVGVAWMAYLEYVCLDQMRFLHMLRP